MRSSSDLIGRDAEYLINKNCVTQRICQVTSVSYEIGVLICENS